MTYWLFAYKNSILQAHQRTDVVSKVTIITDTVKYIFQVGALCVLHNYYAFVIALLISQILNNVLTAIISNRMFPDFKHKGKIYSHLI